MQVSDLMSSDLLTAGPDTTLDDALDLMDRNDVRHLPVVDGDGLVGIVSDRDLLAEGEDDGAQLVREVMHSPVKTLDPEASVVSAALEMSLQKIGCMPVVRRGRLVGLVTAGDLLAAFRDLCADAAHVDQNPSVETRMSRAVRTVSPATSLKEAAELCREIDVRHLPVVEDEKLVGVVSDRDLRMAKGQHLDETTPVREVMAPRAVVVAPEARLAHAAKLMIEHRISSLPVCEGLTQHVVGILTSTDLLDHCMDNLREDE